MPSCLTCGATKPDENEYCSDGFHAPGETYWPASIDDATVERVVRDLAKKLYAHHVVKYDPAAEEVCIKEAIAALASTQGEPGA